MENPERLIMTLEEVYEVLIERTKGEYKIFQPRQLKEYVRDYESETPLSYCVNEPCARGATRLINKKDLNTFVKWIEARYDRTYEANKRIDSVYKD